MARAEAALAKAREDLENLPNAASQDQSQSTQDLDALKAEIRDLSAQACFLRALLATENDPSMSGSSIVALHLALVSELQRCPHISAKGCSIIVLHWCCWQAICYLCSLCAYDTFAFQVTEYEQNMAELKGNLDDYSRDLNRHQGAPCLGQL